MQSDATKYLEKQKKMMEVNHQVGIWAPKELKAQVFDKYPKYVKETEQNTGSGINQYNCVLNSESLLFDSKKFGDKLLQWMLENRADNFSIKCNSEVSELFYDTKTGLVNAAKIMGKRGDAIECDAVVMCTGAATARNLSSLLSVRCPVLPLKCYSFDMPCQYSNQAWIFEDKDYSVVPLSGAN